MRRLSAFAAAITGGLVISGTVLAPAAAQQAVAPAAQLADVPEHPRTPDAPEGFTSFDFPGHEREAQLLSSYLWYHFHHRLGNDLVLFNKEYLLMADMWLNNATPRGEEESIQQIHRENLLEIEIDPEGYVSTHQHISQAHDWGWPFPLWAQAGAPEQTIGWHFKPAEAVKPIMSLFVHPNPEAFRDTVGQGAVDAWETARLESHGIDDDRWQLTATGAAPTLISPTTSIDTFEAPYLQLRWNRSEEPSTFHSPYVEWKREGDEDWSASRRVYFYPEQTHLSPDDLYHSIMTMHTHPEWTGTVTQLRIVLAPGDAAGTDYAIDSFFTVYDTRHTINNPIFVMASDYYFDWTRDLEFLRENVNRMRTAMRYMQTELGGLEHNHIRVPWPGHGGLAGWVRDDDGKLTIRGGHGIGENYWDLMPFGWDSFYATYQYYGALLAMADVEEAIAANPGWNIPRGTLTLSAEDLRAHAEEVKATANETFWNEAAGRFYASIDKEGRAYDFGYTFVNLDAIWYGIASDERAQDVMAWITGERLVEGDTSTGEDIYRWRFGPRATTKRNVEWYGQGWTDPAGIEWGGQIQDGGAVLGFSFYDLWARLHVLGPENAWQRLSEILAWEAEVREGGGYRAYYADGTRGKLQGGGPPGGLGIDQEFYESSLIPSIVTYGFVGIEPTAASLWIRPRLPESCPEMRIDNLWYRGEVLDVTATNDQVTLRLDEAPVSPLSVRFEGTWALAEADSSGDGFELHDAGTYTFTRGGS